MSGVPTVGREAAAPRADRTQGRWQRWLRPIALGCLVPLGLAVWYFNLPAFAWQWGAIALRGTPARAVLHEYRVVVDGVAIAGLTRNASGLTYNPATGTLFAVINRPQQVAELSVDGELLRLMPIVGARDTEGIAHVRDEVFVISDEADNRLYRVRIAADTREIAVDSADSLALTPAWMDNQGVEGLSWDARAQRLLVVEEKWPMRVTEIVGAGPWLTGEPLDEAVLTHQPASASVFTADLSSVEVHQASGNLLLLSDLSGVITEYAPDGTALGVLPLWRGYRGLSASVPQAEGLAVGADGALYVLSEPNLFYRFERTAPAAR